MKNEILNELRTLWPALFRDKSRILSGAKTTSSLRRPQERDSSQDNTDSTMQPCWPTCEPDVNVEKFTTQLTLGPCEFCFQPTETDLLDTTRERQCSEPVRVPYSPTDILIHYQQQSQSSGYGSVFGNGLSPTVNYWISGVSDLSSYPSSTVDDQDQSIFDESSTTDGLVEEKLDDDDDDDSFEVLSFDGPPESTLYIKEFQHTTTHSQNNVCGCCNLSFSSISNLPPRRCHYYGKLYCSRCHIMETAYIPAKIIKSFDMRRYPVCRRAKSILQLNFYQPIFDIQHDNETLYTFVPILSEIKAMRVQFQHFYVYLSTCPRIENELNEKFFKEFYARDYLYQSVHLYSLDDLLSLKKILRLLNIITIRAKQHIRDCILCREKGFTCEICKDRKEILYPFDDMKIIARCDHCSNIYHRQCWENIDYDCPKCYRLIQRKYEQDTM